MAIRSEIVSPRLRRLLLKLRPELKKASPKVQHGIAYLLSVSTKKTRQHRSEDGYMTISYQEIQQRFGREGKALLVETHKVFETTGRYSVKDGETRAYRVVADIAAALDTYYRNAHRGKLSKLTDKAGRRIRTLPAAIESLDDSGQAAKAQGKDAVVSFVPVQRKSVVAYRKALEKHQRSPQMDFFTSNDPKDIAANLDAAGRLNAATHDHNGVQGVLHRYQEKSAGRLYADGVNLQTAPRELKAVALQGHWEYDISNCHYTILHQMAADYGLDLPAIKHYLDNKPEVRRELMDYLDATSDQIKTCLVSLIYGSRDSHREVTNKVRDAIPHALGSKDKALRLYKHPIYIDIKQDTLKGRRRVIHRSPRSRKRIQNLMGKWIREDAPPEKILSHLLQGAEMAMQQAIRKLYPLSLLQHDGWTSADRLDVEQMEIAIEKATGFVVEIEETRLQIPAALA